MHEWFDPSIVVFKSHLPVKPKNKSAVQLCQTGKKSIAVDARQSVNIVTFHYFSWSYKCVTMSRMKGGRNKLVHLWQFQKKLNKTISRKNKFLQYCGFTSMHGCEPSSSSHVIYFQDLIEWYIIHGCCSKKQGQHGK